MTRNEYIATTAANIRAVNYRDFQAGMSLIDHVAIIEISVGLANRLEYAGVAPWQTPKQSESKLAQVRKEKSNE